MRYGWLCLVIAALVAFGSGCTGGPTSADPVDEGPDHSPREPEDAGPDSSACELSPTLLTPTLGRGSLVRFAVSGCVLDDSVRGTLVSGGREYDVRPNGTSELVALLGDAEAGTLQLELRVGTSTFSFTAQGIARAPLQDPSGFLAQWQTGMEQDMAAVSDAEFRAALERTLAEFRVELAKLSDDEKRQLAEIAHANQLLPSTLAKAACPIVTPEQWTGCLNDQLEDARNHLIGGIAVAAASAAVPPLAAVIAPLASIYAGIHAIEILQTLVAMGKRVCAVVAQEVGLSNKALGPIVFSPGVPVDVVLRAPYVGLADADKSRAPLLQQIASGFAETSALLKRVLQKLGISRDIPAPQAGVSEDRNLPGANLTVVKVSGGWTVTAVPLAEGGLRLTLTHPTPSRLAEVTLRYVHEGVAEAEIPVLLTTDDLPDAGPKCKGIGQRADTTVAATCGNGVLDGAERCDSSSLSPAALCASAATACEINLAAGASYQLEEASLTGPAVLAFSNDDKQALVPRRAVFSGGAFWAVDVHAVGTWCKETRFESVTGTLALAIEAVGSARSLVVTEAATVSLPKGGTVNGTHFEGAWSLKITSATNSSGGRTIVPDTTAPLSVPAQGVVSWQGGSAHTGDSRMTVPLRVQADASGWSVVLGGPSSVVVPPDGQLRFGDATGSGLTLPLTSVQQADGSWATVLTGRVSLVLTGGAWLSWGKDGHASAAGPITLPLETVERADGGRTTLFAGPATVAIGRSGSLHWEGGVAEGPANVPLASVKHEDGNSWSTIVGVGSATISSDGSLRWGDGGSVQGGATVPLAAIQRSDKSWTTVVVDTSPLELLAGASAEWAGGGANGPATVRLKAVEVAKDSWVSVVSDRFPVLTTGENASLYWEGGYVSGATSVPLKAAQRKDGNFTTILNGPAYVVAPIESQLAWAGAFASGAVPVPLTSVERADGSFMTILSGPSFVSVPSGGRLYWGRNGETVGVTRQSTSVGSVRLHMAAVQDADGAWTTTLSGPTSVTLPASDRLYWQGGNALGPATIPLRTAVGAEQQLTTIFSGPVVLQLPLNGELSGTGAGASGPASVPVESKQNPDGSWSTLLNGKMEYGSCTSFRAYTTLQIHYSTASARWESIGRGPFCQSTSQCDKYLCCGSWPSGVCL